MAYGPPAGFVRNKPVVFIDEEFCTGCMTCVRICPLKTVLRASREVAGKVEVADPLLCAGCGRCMFACPTNAIRISMA